MLYIIRHGKTDWNELHKLQGHTDIPLNANGIAMAENAAKEYKNVHFDVCYCSPLTRARQTADIILRDRDEKVPVIIDDRLIEMCFGEYEGIQGYTDDAGYNVNTLFIIQLDIYRIRAQRVWMSFLQERVNSLIL